ERPTLSDQASIHYLRFADSDEGFVAGQVMRLVIPWTPYSDVVWLNLLTRPNHYCLTIADCRLKKCPHRGILRCSLKCKKQRDVRRPSHVKQSRRRTMMLHKC